jgi:alpha,alpha-trehalase
MSIKTKTEDQSQLFSKTNLFNRLSKKVFPKKKIEIKDLTIARKYIKDYWPKLERYHPKDDENLIGLPNKYLVPSYEADHEFDFNELYYWDSYFMIQGMLDNEHKDLVIGILENLVFLYKRFKIIPNASRTYLTGRSQPPFLTSFIFDVYDAYNLNKKWLKEMMVVAESEYNTVWMGTKKPNIRKVHNGLSRYYDINHINDLAEAESGWDMTTRFNHQCLDYLPIDLNALLYKYEMDFARYYDIIGDKLNSKAWKAKASNRKKEIDKLMWSNLRGIYLDYNYVKQKRSSVASLATYYPMFTGMVSQEKAKLLVDNLRRFEQRGGLTTTEGQKKDVLILSNPPTQWAYPNGWAPLHFITIMGLERYGYHEDAKRIAQKWLKTNSDWFYRHKVFLEKYNVVSPNKPPMKGLYPSQVGFGWTNAVFERLCQEYIDK